MNNFKDPTFYLGVCENRMDPLKLGRVQVRVLGLHTWNKSELPTEDLPWAYKIQPSTSGAISGIGTAPVGVMEGTWVAVQYIDPEKQMPFIIGSLGGIPQSKNPSLESFEFTNSDSNVQSSDSNVQETEVEYDNTTVGFKDPNFVYPLKTHLNEPDTNRLARHEKIPQTVVLNKEQKRHKNIPKANGGTWDQSPIPYNATYPYNNVTQTESGHIMEFDDTKDKERIHLYHTKGTYTEIDHNGTQVNFIVGDSYVIMERNGYAHIVGNLHVAVDGAHTLRVNNTLDVQVNGNANINCHSNANLNVAGDLNISAGGNIKMKAGGDFALDASRIDLNYGVASGLQTISSIGGTASNPPVLNVLTRGEQIAIDYEVVDDDPIKLSEFQKKIVEEGVLTEEEVKATPVSQEEFTPLANEVKEKPVEQEQINSFTGREQLSKYFKLSDLTEDYTRKLVDQSGLTDQQIFNNLKALAVNVLDPIKEKYPNMKINSGLRLGDAASQHNKGQAVDVSFSGVSRADLYNRCLELQQTVPYDQMLLEYLTPGGNGWIHISYVQGRNRKQIFTMNNHKRVSKDLVSLVRIA